MIYVVSGPGSLVYECQTQSDAARLAALDRAAGMFFDAEAAEKYAAVHQPQPPTAEGQAAALWVAAMLADGTAEVSEVRRAGARLGAMTSPAKAAAARENGKRGGRPRKPKDK